MARLLFVATWILCPALALAQDSPQVARLQQEVRQLQQEVSLLSQLVTQLRARVERPVLDLAPPPSQTTRATAPPPSPAVGTSPTPALARWINAARWRALRTGMSELEVISELGPPTSTRGTEVERVLLYALELGPSSFIAGSVTLRARVVTTIDMPTLR